jgi:hypothetical protein
MDEKAIGQAGNVLGRAIANSFYECSASVPFAPASIYRRGFLEISASMTLTEVSFASF